MLEQVYSGDEKAKAPIGTDVYTDYEDKSNALDQNFLNSYTQDNILELLSDMQFDPKVNWHVNLDSWYNFSKKGGWQHVHDHVGGFLQIQWSGVHYAVFDKEHETTHFPNPRPYDLEVYGLNNQGRNTTTVMIWIFFPKGEEGDIIWFPSYP